MTSLQRLGDATGAPWERWRTEAHRFAVKNHTHFDIPGLDEALALRGLPREHRKLLETLRAGTSSETEGERDSTGRRRRVLRLGATPERPAMRLWVIEADDASFWSRDGAQFGVLRSAVSPAETEAALEGLHDIDASILGATQTGDGGMHVIATLDEGGVRRAVDLRRVLGPDLAAASVTGEVEVEAGPHALRVRLTVTVEAASEMTGPVRFGSTSELVGRDLGDPTICVDVPLVSLGLPELATIDGAFRLSTPRGSRATKGSRRRR